MSTNIKPIQTSYKGYLFRSRLEARWAVFFDALEIEWEYEPEGFELPSGRYLPDFWCPFSDCWAAFNEYPNPGFFIEIKPTEPTPLELQKARELAQGTKHGVLIFAGPPNDKFQCFWANNSGRVGVIDASTVGGDLGDIPGGVLALHCQIHQLEPRNVKSWSRALQAFRSARFEYGQTPKARSHS